MRVVALQSNAYISKELLSEIQFTSKYALYTCIHTYIHTYVLVLQFNKYFRKMYFSVSHSSECRCFGGGGVGVAGQIEFSIQQRLRALVYNPQHTYISYYSTYCIQEYRLIITL